MCMQAFLMIYAVYSCRQVLQVFEDKQWALIDGHLQDMLGRHAVQMGNLSAAAFHFTNALGCKDVHPDRQHHLLHQLIQITEQLEPEQV